MRLEQIDSDDAEWLACCNNVCPGAKLALSLAAFTVRLSIQSTSAVAVSYTTANGTALAGSDFVQSSGTITFAPGQTTVMTVTMQPVGKDFIGAAK